MEKENQELREIQYRDIQAYKVLCIEYPTNQSKFNTIVQSLKPEDELIRV